MTTTVRRHQAWLVRICALAALVISFYGWQQLHAQVSPTVTPATPGTTAGPTLQIGAVMPSGVKAMNIKNWDGTVTTVLRFKYKTIDNKVITVHLPGTYKTEKMTREAWDTLFQCFGMDLEAQQDMKGRNKMQEWGAIFSQAISQAQEQADNGEAPPGENPASAAFDYARSHATSGMGSVTLPPLLPGMF